MHASDAQLLTIRDGEPVAADISSHVRDCPSCLVRLEQLESLRRRLTSLPAPAGPGAGSLAEALAMARVRRRKRVLGVAAALALAVLLPVLAGRVASPIPAVAVTQNPPTASQLDGLVAQSQALEAALQQIAPRGQVLDGNTAATVASLENSLATVDARLSANSGSSPRLRQALWTQRVTLMQSLVSVRYAADQSQAF